MNARHLSLMQQATLCIALGAVSLVAWSIEPRLHFHQGHDGALSFMLFAFVALGTYVADMWFSYDLRSGVEAERWPAEQIERFRATFDARWTVGAYLLLMLAVTFFLLVDLPMHRHVPKWCFGLLMGLQPLSQLLSATRRPRPRTPAERIDWNSLPRISSDHWGRGDRDSV